MGRSMRVVLVGMVAATGVLAACGGPTKFDPMAFNDTAAIQKNAGNYWKRDGWWAGLPKDVAKVAITQFSVEYVTQQTSKSGASALSLLGGAEMLGMGNRKRQFPDDLKRTMPTSLYDGFVSGLKAEGIEVVPMAELQKNPAFGTLKAAAAGKTYGQGNQNESAKMQVFPADGLPLLDDGWLNMNAGDNLMSEYKLVGDSGAQAGLRVRIRVALNDDGHAVLGAGSTVFVSYDLKQENWRNKGAEWILKQRGQLTNQGAMRDDVAVVDSKEFKAFEGDIYTVNGPKYQESVMKIYPAYARMAAVKLKG